MDIMVNKNNSRVIFIDSIVRNIIAGRVILKTSFAITFPFFSEIMLEDFNIKPMMMITNDNKKL